MSDSIRVVIADDHAIVRSGIRALLATERDIDVVGEAADGHQAVIAAEQLQPDVMLMDLALQYKNGKTVR
ncbi:MAG: response regulator transcription factor [Roseiflexaceae bacterium]